MVQNVVKKWVFPNFHMSAIGYFTLIQKNYNIFSRVINKGVFMIARGTKHHEAHQHHITFL